MPPIYALHDMDLSNYAIIFSEIKKTLTFTILKNAKTNIYIFSYSWHVTAFGTRKCF